MPLVDTRESKEPTSSKPKDILADKILSELGVVVGGGEVEFERDIAAQIFI